jgi:hypothetical protein
VLALCKIVIDAVETRDDLLSLPTSSKHCTQLRGIYYGVHRDLTVKLDVKCREIDENVAGTALGCH